MNDYRKLYYKNVEYDRLGVDSYHVGNVGKFGDCKLKRLTLSQLLDTLRVAIDTYKDSSKININTFIYVLLLLQSFADKDGKLLIDSIRLDSHQTIKDCIALIGSIPQFAYIVGEYEAFLGLFNFREEASDKQSQLNEVYIRNKSSNELLDNIFINLDIQARLIDLHFPNADIMNSYPSKLALIFTSLKANGGIGSSNTLDKILNGLSVGNYIQSKTQAFLFNRGSKQGKLISAINRVKMVDFLPKMFYNTVTNGDIINKEFEAIEAFICNFDRLYRLKTEKPEKYKTLVLDIVPKNIKKYNLFLPDSYKKRVTEVLVDYERLKGVSDA